MEILGILVPTFQGLVQRKSEIEALKVIWETKARWEALYNACKDLPFKNLQVWPSFQHHDVLF